MIGIYRFYQHGELIAEQRNVITDMGKRAILRYIAGQIPGLATGIGIGTGATAASATDTELDFEVEKVLVELGTVDYDNEIILFKGTIPQESVYDIYEVGLWSETEESIENFLTAFESADEEWSVGTFDTTNARIGGDALRLTAAASATTTSRLTDVTIDLTEYKFSDKMKLAYTLTGAMGNLTVRLMKDDTNYYSAVIGSHSAGYNVKTLNKGDFTSTGSPDWSDITMIELSIVGGTGGATVDFDGFRIKGEEVPTEDTLISRAVLGAPVLKTDIAAMDIEYSLGVSL